MPRRASGWLRWIRQPRRGDFLIDELERLKPHVLHFIGHGGRYIWRTGPPDLRKNNPQPASAAAPASAKAAPWPTINPALAKPKA